MLPPCRLTSSKITWSTSRVLAKELRPTETLRFYHDDVQVAVADVTEERYLPAYLAPFEVGPPIRPGNLGRRLAMPKAEKDQAKPVPGEFLIP